MNSNVIGMDIAKNIFHLLALTATGKVAFKKKLKRAQLLTWFAQQPLCTVAMEACGGAHYWARELQALGFAVKLIPAQHVKSLVMGNKNDYNDALAIAEAVGRPRIHPVPVKTVEQQERQALHQIRKGLIAQRTALGNQLRGLLAEQGFVIKPGMSALRLGISELLVEEPNRLTSGFQELLDLQYRQLLQLDEYVKTYDKKLLERNQHNEAIQRLLSIPGFGPVLSNYFYAEVCDGTTFPNGRAVSAWVGLIPRQHTTGDKPQLLGITKRGNKQLRSLLVQGAHAVLMQAESKADGLSRWAMALKARRGIQKAAVALANKMARIGWAILKSGEHYEARPLQA